MSELLYFGYGANRSYEMMDAIIGRRPSGYYAELQGYELCVQLWGEIPERAREMLGERGWDPTFRAYCIRQASERIVSGMLWSLTSGERELVSEWAMYGLWYETVTVPVTKRGQIIEAETEVINDPWIMQVVAGISYPEFLNKRKDMLRTSNMVRESYLARK